jgi:CHASE2 domain-containing sensor protein
VSAATRHPPFWRYFGLGAAVVLVAAIATFLMEDSWFFRHMENSNLDVWLNAKAAAPSGKVFVVSITDEDYKGLFGGSSPLNPQKVEQIIAAIVHSGARLLGVDLDTSGWSPRDVAAVPKGIPIVWAREYSEENSKMENVLGSNDPGVCFGLPAYTPDEDGVIRHYQPVVTLPGGGKEFSFAARLLATCEAKPTESEGGGEEGKLINYLGGSNAFGHLSAGALLTLSAVPSWSESKNPLRGKIVLLGGAFRAARDKFYTPAGRMDGVDIIAHTIESESPGGEVKTPGSVFFFATDLLLGLSLVAGGWLLPRKWALPAMILVVTVAAFLGSWLAFRSFGYFASFVPVLAGVLMHELFEHFVEHHELIKEHRELVHESEELRRELERLKHS